MCNQYMFNPYTNIPINAVSKFWTGIWVGAKSLV